MNIRNFIFFISIVFIQITAHGCSGTQSTVDQMRDQPPNMIRAEKTDPIELRPIGLELPEGHKLGRIGMGVLCIPMTDLKTIGGKAKVSENDFTDVVRTVLENAGYNLADTSANSVTHAHDDGLVLQGTIKDLKANACFPKSGFRSWEISKGESHVKIYWQISSRENDKILFETITEGSDKLSEAIGHGITKIILGSVAGAAENLIADKQFNMIVTNLMN